jgi:putative cardiolipin synthase
VRLFNPFTSRANVVGQGIEFVRRFARLDQRMHNKLMVADGRAAVVGGRNLAGEHFGLDDTMNLVDFDVLLTGDEAAGFTGVFESYWTSPLAVDGHSLAPTVTDADLAAARAMVAEALRGRTRQLTWLQADGRDWPRRRRAEQLTLAPGSVTVLADSPGVARPKPGTQVIEALRETAEAARRDLVVATPFFVPSEGDVRFYRELVGRGARFRVLTNSLASNPGTISNSGLSKQRAAVLNAGVELHELRTDAAVKPAYESPPHVARYLGLHGKIYVIDRERTYLGSVNLDPRSRHLNTEMGILIDNPHLAGAAADAILELMTLVNAWEVTLDPDGRPQWRDSTHQRHHQPARGPAQRLADLAFRMLPIEAYI